MGFKTTGTIRAIFDTKQISASFTKREFVVEVADNPKYPQQILMELAKDRCVLLDDVVVGDTVAIEFDLRGREWRSPSGEVKYFNTVGVWKLEVTNRAARPSGGGEQDSIPFASCSLADEPSPIAKVLR